jgi:hypothetical protein
MEKSAEAIVCAWQQAFQVGEQGYIFTVDRRGLMDYGSTPFQEVW